MPATGSVPENVTVRGALCQPFAFAGREGVAAVWGAVASCFTGREAEPPFPARSTQVPLTVATALSGPEYVFAPSQASRPEVASPPVKLTVSGALYQPFAFPARAGDAVTCGALASYLR